jgi:hypothetical protein
MEFDKVIESNPSLDEEYGHRAELVLPDVINKTEWDKLVDHLCSRKCSLPKKIRLRRHSIPRTKFNPLAANLYTVSCSTKFLVNAIYAGFFPYGVPYACSDRAIASELCGFVTLELGGMGRERKQEVDPGGRLILEASGASIPLVLGKKSLKTIAPHPLSTSVLPSGTFQYALRVSHDVDGCWQRVVDLHGVDWCGLDCIRTPLLALPRLSRNASHQPHSPPLNHPTVASNLSTTGAVSPVYLISVELWDTLTKQLASAEVGTLCGRAYTVLTLFANTTDYPRCDHVRAQASILHLHRCGVTLFDVGTTANYYRSFFGFKKTTRSEFVKAWRRHRDIHFHAIDTCEPTEPSAEAGLHGISRGGGGGGVDWGRVLEGCTDVRGLLQAHQQSTMMFCASDGKQGGSGEVGREVHVSSSKGIEKGSLSAMNDGTSSDAIYQSDKSSRSACMLFVTGIQQSSERGDSDRNRASTEYIITTALAEFGSVLNVKLLGGGKAFVVFSEPDAVRNVLNCVHPIVIGEAAVAVSGPPTTRKSNKASHSKRSIDEMYNDVQRIATSEQQEGGL